MTMGRKKFEIDRDEGKLLGVCAGLANHSGIDATIIRVAAVLLTIAGGFPWTVIAYLAAAWFGAPKRRGAYGLEESRAGRASREETRERMRELDLRLQAIETYTTSSNSRLAREIEELR